MAAMTSFRKTLWKLTMREPVGKKELLLALWSYSFGHLAMKQHSHYQLYQSDHHQPTLAMLQSRGGSLCWCLVPTGRLWRYHKFACLVHYHKYQPDNSVNFPCHLRLDLNQWSLNLMSGPLPSEPTRQPRWSLEKLFVLCIKKFLDYTYIVVYIYI